MSPLSAVRNQQARRAASGLLVVPLLVGSFQMERMVRVGASEVEVLDRLPFQLDPR